MKVLNVLLLCRIVLLQSEQPSQKEIVVLYLKHQTVQAYQYSQIISMTHHRVSYEHQYT